MPTSLGSFSTEELISLALSHADGEGCDNPHWTAVHTLHYRGTREVFDAAARLLASPCPVERTLGANVHAQLGYMQDKPFAAESGRLLADLLDGEADPNVIHAALVAFGHLQQPGCVPAALRFVAHPDDDIRYAVAFALAGRDDERAIAALITLTTDASVKVRDWATFGLASQTDWDGPQLRTALRARLTDPDNVTRGEALKGLASRRDPGAVEAVIAELCGPDPSEYAVEAAEELAEPRLVPALEALRGRVFAGEWLEGVIERCRGES
jgi:HEAT repeat protein